MGAGGTATFNESSEYQASVIGARLGLVLTAPGHFRGDLAWLKMHHISIVRGRESLSRIGFVEVAPGSVLLCVASTNGPADHWGAMPLQPGEVFVLGSGSRIHHRTTSASCWTWIAVDQARLGAHCRALLHAGFLAASGSIVMRPSGAILAELSRLVAEACRIAALTRDVVARPEAMRALELHILDATVECLTTGKGNDVRSRPAEIAAAYELALETCGADARMPVILAFMGSTERILESACAACFGMSPNAYRRLRRLNRVRSALGHATATTTIAEIATSFGVSELGRFAGEYRKAFGEPPSHTLRSARSRCL